MSGKKENLKQQMKKKDTYWRTKDKDDRFLIGHDTQKTVDQHHKSNESKNVNLEFYIQWKHFSETKADTQKLEEFINNTSTIKIRNVQG